MLNLDSDASLPFNLKLVQVLCLGAFLDGTCQLQQSVRKCALAVINVCNDAEVSDALERKVC